MKLASPRRPQYEDCAPAGGLAGSRLHLRPTTQIFEKGESQRTFGNHPFRKSALWGGDAACSPQDRQLGANPHTVAALERPTSWPKSAILATSLYFLAIRPRSGTPWWPLGKRNGVLKAANRSQIWISVPQRSFSEVERSFENHPFQKSALSDGDAACSPQGRQLGANP